MSEKMTAKLARDYAIRLEQYCDGSPMARVAVVEFLRTWADEQESGDGHAVGPVEMTMSKQHPLCERCAGLPAGHIPEFSQCRTCDKTRARKDFVIHACRACVHCRWNQWSVFRCVEFQTLDYVFGKVRHALCSELRTGPRCTSFQETKEKVNGQ